MKRINTLKGAPIDSYWICVTCARSRGWEPVDVAFTMVERACPQCGEVTRLACAHTDFVKNGKEPIVWD
jgi:hypothetical protein